MIAAPRLAAALLLMILLAACTAPQPRAPQLVLLQQQADREQVLAAQDGWRIVGRIAISDANDSGSGRVDWLHGDNATVIEMSAPVSRQSWRLTTDAAGARLDGLEGGARKGSDATELLARELGWDMPLAQMPQWVRGARAEGPAEIEFGADGRPRVLLQSGWRVEYRDWMEGTDPALPRRVFATRGDQRVRLVVERWYVGPG